VCALRDSALKKEVEQILYPKEQADMAIDLDAEFGGTEARQKLEKRLLRKLDFRMSILVVIYILNYVRPPRPKSTQSSFHIPLECRLTGITQRKDNIVIEGACMCAHRDSSAARLRGFEEDLHLKGQEFNTILSILYVGYILMQVPS